VLVDEASAGLAPIAVTELFETLRDVNRSGVTILMVEQNVTFSLGVADRAHIMQQGRIVYEGDVKSLDKDAVAGYLGVGRLFGRHVAAAADARRAPTGQATDDPPPIRRRTTKTPARKPVARVRKPAAAKTAPKRAASTRTRKAT